MDTNAQRRTLLRHGFLLFLLALLLGLPAGAGAPHARQWLGAHLTLMMNGLIVMAVGFVWRDLRLSAGQAKATFVLTLTPNWVSFVIGVWTSLFGIGGPVSGAGEQHPAWQMAVVNAGFAVIVLGSLAAIGLVIWGLRGSSAPA